jgi:hypothetical protein
MSKLRIDLLDDRTTYLPGERVEGVVTWDLDKASSRMEVRLTWFTEGRGSEDTETVDSVRFEDPAPRDVQSFSLQLPEQPLSCSGRLVSIRWAVEATTRWGRAQERRAIVMSWTGEPVQIPARPEVRDKDVPGMAIRSY